MSRSSRVRIAILGSTGSIGRQTIDVVKAASDRFEVVALVAGRDRVSLEHQALELRVESTGLGSDEAVAFARSDEVDVVVNAIVGAAGLRASVATLEAGKTLALANKESLVAGGEVCLAAAERGGGRIVPVDSEHAALLQALEGRDLSSVRRVVLTASGGPLRTVADLSAVTPAQALAHPTWNMGAKISIDSATLMNKGLEVIEAHHLFGLEYDRIDTVVHPQSVVHGIVEFRDSSMLMQAAPADMRIPIAAALSSPGQLDLEATPISLADVGALTFEQVDHDRFPSVSLAYEAGRQGGTSPAVLNAANEVAVAAFLHRTLPFIDIAVVVADTLARHEPTDAGTLESVLTADAWARSVASDLIQARRTTQVSAT